MKLKCLAACACLSALLAACGGSSDAGAPAGGSPALNLNRCVDPAYMALPTGWSTAASYALTGAINGDETVTITIDGPATFEGATRTQIIQTTNQSVELGGVSSNMLTVTKGYYQAGSGDITRHGFLDATTTTTAGVTGPTTENKLVYTPAVVEQQYTLGLGKSYTSTEVVVVTPTKPTPMPPSTISTTTTVTHVADETITVLGKSYDTCKVEFNTSGQGVVTAWYLAGKGMQVKLQLQSTNGVVTQLTELKSGTYNGTPL
jgi:hypothetical protein